MNENNTPTTDSNQLLDIVIPVEGMSCGGCADGLQAKLEMLDGIVEVDVDFAAKSASIIAFKSKQSHQSLVDTIVAAGYSVPIEEQAVALQNTRFSVEGMTCTGCSSGLEKKLLALDGVSSASINFALSAANIEYDVSKVSMALIQKAVNEAGYQIPLMTHVFDVGGMTCSGCALGVEKAVLKHEGVLHADVNLAVEKIEIQANASVTAVDLMACITQAGYSASLPNTNQTIEDKHQNSSWQTRFKSHGFLLCVGIMLSLPMVLQMISMTLGGQKFLPGWLELALATPVQFWVGAHFYRGALRAIRSRNGNMDLLVVLGTSAAFLYSCYLLLSGTSNHLYFESAAVVITLVMLGKWLETRAKQSATAAIRELMALRPQSARRLHEGQEEIIPLSKLALGDVVVVKPGEAIPVDGVLLQGIGEVDESLISGESMPVNKVEGDKLTGGAINGNGRLHISVSALGKDTTLSQIIEIVEKAQSGKAPVQRLVDRISAVFVPVVIVISLLTLLAWVLIGAPLEQAIIAAVSVLVIACPCALGLATPTALVAGTGVAAKAGILIKDIATLENASKINRVIFDKTGTLTKGKPVVTDYQSFSDDSFELGLAASLQSGSEHPLASALCHYAKGNDVLQSPINTFENLPGSGVMGEVEGRSVIIGNLSLLVSHNQNMAQYHQHFEALEAEGKTAVGIIIDGEFQAVIGFADELREESAEAIETLHRNGILTAILSGASDQVTKVVANKLSIDAYNAGLKPAEKAQMVENYKSTSEFVAMVGDGVNDAPALAVADLGIAMGSGTDVAIASSSFTLLRSDPRLVAAALEIATVTRAKIYQNLFWAFIFNIIGIPLAAFGFLTPTIAGAAMALSSVTVVSNALLLKRWKPKLSPVN